MTPQVSADSPALAVFSTRGLSEVRDVRGVALDFSGLRVLGIIGLWAFRHPGRGPPCTPDGAGADTGASKAARCPTGSPRRCGSGLHCQHRWCPEPGALLKEGGREGGSLSLECGSAGSPAAPLRLLPVQRCPHEPGPSRDRVCVHDALGSPKAASSGAPDTHQLGHVTFLRRSSSLSLRSFENCCIPLSLSQVRSVRSTLWMRWQSSTRPGCRRPPWPPCWRSAATRSWWSCQGTASCWSAAAASWISPRSCAASQAPRQLLAELRRERRRVEGFSPKS